MLLSQLLKKFDYKGDFQDTEISDIVYDSRKIKEGCLFVCLKGASFDGHTFALLSRLYPRYYSPFGCRSH